MINTDLIIKDLDKLFTTINASSFWSNFTSSFIVAILLGLFLPWYISYLKKPKRLEIFVRENSTSTSKVRSQNPNQLSYCIEPAFRHSSGHAFLNGVYWHLYIPKFLNPVAGNLEQNTLPMQQDSGTYIHFSGEVIKPIFPGTARAFFYKFSGSFDANIQEIQAIDKVPIYYFLSTEYGFYPKSFKYEDKDICSVNLKNCSKFYLKIER